MSLEVLEKNWLEILERVVKPLWRNEFKSMYEAAKLDYNDFESLAGYELTKAFATFNNLKSNLFTYATNVLRNKARTELRNNTLRDKRRALTVSESLNVPISEDDDTELINFIEDKPEDTNSDLSEKRVGEFLKKLSNQQLRILVLKLLDFDNDDIPEILGLTKIKVNDSMRGLKRNDIIMMLYRRKF